MTYYHCWLISCPFHFQKHFYVFSLARLSDVNVLVVHAISMP